MIRRSTWIMLAVFAAVVAFTWYWQSTADTRPSSETPTPTYNIPQALWSLDETTIANLSISDSQGKRVVLGRDEAGLWKLVEPAGGETDVAAAESAVSQLAGLQVATSLEGTQELSVFGLSQPAYTISLTLNGGETHTLLVGDKTPTNTGYYVRLDDELPKVINTYSLDPVLGMLQNPPFAPTPTLSATTEISATQTIQMTPVLTNTVEP